MVRRGGGSWVLIVGECPECGGVVDSERRRRWWVRLGYRLVYGPAPVTFTCVNGHEWEGSPGSAAPLRHVGVRRRHPVVLWRVLWRGRRWVLAPYVWLVAAAVGVGLGVVADVVAGWPWWSVAVGFFGLVWLLAASSGLWGGDPGVRAELVRVVAPRRAEARELRLLEAAVADGRLVCLEVPGWSILRYGGHADGGEEAVSLMFGDPDSDASVAVTARTGERTTAEVDHRRTTMVKSLLFPPQAEGLDAAGQAQWHREVRRRLAAAELPPWTSAVLEVDGKAVSCVMARVSDSVWAGEAVFGGTTVELAVRGVGANAIAFRRLTTLSGLADRLEGR